MCNTHNEVADPQKKTAKRSIDPFWADVNKARRVFDVQLTKDNDVKLACLKKCMGHVKDPQKFFNSYQEKVKWLLDSKQFTEQCALKNYNPTAIAEHIVFLGSATMRSVRENGLYDSRIANDLDLYAKSFLPGDAQAFANA